MQLNNLYLGIIIIMMNLKKMKGLASLLISVIATANLNRTDKTYNGTTLPCTPIEISNKSHLNMIVDATDSNNLVWTGTHLNYTKWMDYKGCYQLFKLENVYNKTFSKTPSLYDCYNTCTKDEFHTFIGLQRNICYCLKDGEYDRRTHCNTSTTICSDNPRLLCGNGNINVAVYIIINLTPNEIDSLSHGHCGTLYNGGGGPSLKVHKCNNKAYPVCFDSINSSNKVYNQTQTTWTGSMKKCENMQLTPSTNVQIRRKRIKLSNDGYYWISTIRGSKIYSYKDNNDTFKSHCLAALIDDQLTIKSLVPLNCLTNLRVLCENATTTTTEVTTTRQSSIGIVTSDDASDDYISSISPATLTTAQSLDTTGNFEGVGPTEYTDINLSTNNSNVSNIHSSTRNATIPWTIIGVSAGGGLVLLIIIVIVYHVTKSKTKSKTRQLDVNKQGRPDSTVEPYHTTEMSNMVTNNQHDTSGQGEDNVYDHTDHNPSGPKHGQSDVQESEYHTMADVRNDTEGLYDTSRGPDVTIKQDFTEQIYDHSGTSGRNDFVESTYDHV